MKNLILNYYSIHKTELVTLTDSLDTFVIENNNHLIGDIAIVGYENLKSIVINNESLQNIRSLTIAKNPLLKNIVFEDNACEYVMKLELAGKK